RRATDEFSSETQIAMLVRSAGSAYLSLAQRAAGDLGDAVALVVPSESLPVFSTGDLDSNPAGPLWSGSWEGGLRPITESVGTAFQFLWSAPETGNPRT